MSAATYALVHGEVGSAAAAPLDVGLSAPMSVYTVQALHQRRAGVSGYGARVMSRFVGRVQELAVLQASLARAAHGHGQVVGIVGDPGMGKSRLLAEFRQRLAGQAVTYYTGHCLPYGQATPYLPVRDVLRQHWGLSETDRPEVVTATVHRGLQEAGLNPEEDAPFLLQLLDVPVHDARLAHSSPQERRAWTFRVLHQVSRHASQRQRLVLTVEDAHWIDATSETWLTTLVERLGGTPILVLLTYRPGYRPPWLGQSAATQMALSRLTPQESLTVVQSVLQTATLPAAVGQEIITKAAGNPFFLEELAWTVRTSGLTHHSHALPTTIQAVLAARLDRLPPAEKTLVQTAAVIGPEVPIPLLQAVVDMAADDLQALLERLQNAELLYEAHLVPVPIYTFKHALTQEAAYGSLLQERRRALHARIVAVLETWSTGRIAEQVERLADHAWRGELWEKALLYSRQAGEKALAQSAHHEAVGCFERALSALQHLPARRDTRAQAIDLRLALRTALFPLGDVRRILATLREAEALAAGLDDPRRLGQVSRFLAQHLYFFMGRHDQAITAAQRACALATTGGDVALYALANLFLGVAYQAQGDYRRAIDCCEKSMASLTEAQHHERFGEVFPAAVISRAWLTACHAELGTFVAGRAVGEEGLQIAETIGHLPSIMFISWELGLLALRQGDLCTALALLERATRICHEGNLPIYLPRVAATLGAAYTLDGRAADAIPLLTQALEQTVAQDMRGLQTLCMLPLGEAQLMAGHLEEAHVLAERALTLARAHQERGNQAYALRLLGEAAAHQEPPHVALAEAHFRQAITLAEELGMQPLQAHCHRSLGTLYARTSQRQQARAALTTAVERYRAMDMTFWQSRTEAVLAQEEARRS
jgi:tetratricopeptide (TPR) repeat protein